MLRIFKLRYCAAVRPYLKKNPLSWMDKKNNA